MLAAQYPLWVVVPGAAIVGFASGIVSGLLGIGGATVTTPGVRLLGGTPTEAIGSTIPAIIPGAISGAWRYSREGLVEWRLALILGGAGSVMAVIGALVSGVVPGGILMVATAVLMLWSGGSVLLKLRKTHDRPLPIRPGEASARPSALFVGVLGGCGGFLAGILGVGGGVILVPVLSGPLRVPMRRAVASSLVAVAMFQVPGLITHQLMGHINWTLALSLTVGVVPGAQIGARLNLASSERAIRVIFGVLILTLAIIFGATELHGLVAGA